MWDSFLSLSLRCLEQYQGYIKHSISTVFVVVVVVIVMTCLLPTCPGVSRDSILDLESLGKSAKHNLTFDSYWQIALVNKSNLTFSSCSPHDWILAY